jgi:predicted dehydrogenase
MSLDVVCVGAGFAGTERHLPSLKRDPRVTVLGIVDRDPDRARAAARKHRLPHFGTSLADDWVDGARACTIAVPPRAHEAVVEAAIGRRLHVLCDKPFVLPSDRARALASAASAQERVLAVIHNFQYGRAGSQLFRLLAAGELGAVREVHALQFSNPRRRLPSWHDDLPGGLFFDEAPHLLYLLRRILGVLDVGTVDGRVIDGTVQNVAATFAHPDLWATLTMSFDASISEWQLLVVGERGAVALDLFRDVLVRVGNDGGHRGREVLRTSAAMIGTHVAGVARSGALFAARRLDYGNDEVVRRFVDACDGRPERLEWLTAEDGRAVCAAAEEILHRLGVAVTP